MLLWTFVIYFSSFQIATIPHQSRIEASDVHTWPATNYGYTWTSIEQWMQKQVISDTGPSVCKIWLLWSRAHDWQSGWRRTWIIHLILALPQSKQGACFDLLTYRVNNVAIGPDTDVSIYAMLTTRSVTSECSYIKRSSTCLPWLKAARGLWLHDHQGSPKAAIAPARSSQTDPR